MTPEPTIAELIESMPPAVRAEFEATVRRLALLVAPPPRERRPRARPSPPPAVLPCDVTREEVDRVRGVLRARGVG